jgi:hypothetical protein
VSDTERPLTRAEFNDLIARLNAIAVAPIDALSRIEQRMADMAETFDAWAAEMDGRHRKMLDYVSVVDAKFAALITEYVDHRHGRPDSGTVV